MMSSALILVDIQNDFLPGGALGVSRGDEVISVANRLIPYFSQLIVTQDWHPPGHVSFGSWPDHCIQGSGGAELSDQLKLPERTLRVQKGSDPLVDSYSAFFDNDHLHSTGLAERLREWGVDRLYLIGLTTEYCVKYSALDALALGFKTVVIVDGCRAVDLSPGDGERALEELRAKGVLLSTADVAIFEVMTKKD